MAIFSNVPDWLTNKVRNLSSTLRDADDRGTIYFNAAGWVISFYLRLDVAAPDADKFFDNRVVNENGHLWHGTVNRVILVGETLFLLRSCPAFPEFCRRMRERALRPHFLEMLEAKTFFKAGYDIHPPPGPGVKREDFDFVAIKDGETVNAEVTALTAEEFSEKTVLNALNDKRRQVPKTAPAVLFCIIPEAWLTLDNWNNRLQAIAIDFLRQTSTINFVVFVTERHVDLGGNKGALLIWRNTFENRSPRFPMRDPKFLMSGKAVDEVHTAMRSGGVGLVELEAASHGSEFFRWVDHLVPKP
jgi:hypothetical protein